MEAVPSLMLSAAISAVLSGTVVSAVLAYVLHRKTTRISEEIRSQFEQSRLLFASGIEWKEKALSELLGPVYMELDRTGRAFNRWTGKNLFLEAKVIRDGNQKIRDLLLEKGHLIPPDLLGDAGELIEHYDRWLEEFDRLRADAEPDLETPFVFVGPKGYPFPRKAAENFQKAFKEVWSDLYAASS